MKTEYNSTITSISIHRKGDHPLFGESVTKIELEDDAGGIFFTIKQDPNDFGPGGILRFDFDEVQKLIQVIDTLRVIAENAENDMQIEEINE